jgi:O-antigen/teichoic acid export membrane protein
MSEVKKIGKNSLMSYIARASDLVVGIVTMSIIARYLSIEFFGNYMLVMTCGWILSTIVNMGTEQITVREISRNKEETSGFLVNGIFVNFLLFSICIAIYSLSIPFLKLERVIIFALYLNFLSEAMKAYMRVIISVFIAYEKMGYDALLTFLARVIVLISTIAIVYFKLDFVYLFVSCVAGSGTGLLLGLIILLKKFVVPKIEIQFSRLKYIFVESFPVGINIISQQFYFYIGVYVVKTLENEAAVALFQGPNKLVTLFQIIPIALLAAFQPLMSRLAVSNTSSNKFEYVYQKSFKFLFIVSFPVSVLGMVLAHKIILLVFGVGFKDAVISFQILIWAVNFIFLDVLLTFVLTSINKQRLLIFGNVTCVLTNMILSIIFVKKYGYVGAAWAALISYGVVFIIDFYFVTKNLKCTPLKQGILQPVISSLIAGFILYSFHSLNIVLLFLCGMIIYLGLIWALKTFTREERQLFRSIFVRT